MARKRSRALITGVAGFGGSHLAEHLLAEGYEVLGLDHPSAPLTNLEAVASGIEVFKCDLARLGSGELERRLRGRDLTVVFHLAAIASVRRSWESLPRTVEVNAVGTLGLIEALRRLRRRPALLLVGSADQYGAVPARRQPLREETPLEPKSPYALSKVWQEALGTYYARVEGWPLYLTRTFNHTGPRQSPDFVCSDFARQIARIEAGKAEPVIRVGNLRAARDFLDVRDVVRAYRLLVERGRPGVPYNVSSGAKWKISDILGALRSLSRVRIRVEVESERGRPADIPLLWGNSGRLRRATGWRPQLKLEETLALLLDYWREQASAGRAGVDRVKGKRVAGGR